MIYDFVVDERYENLRLDVYLTAVIDGVTRSYIKNLIDGEKSSVNDVVKKAGYILKTGDRVHIETGDRSMSASAEDIPLDIIYQDDDFAVINKKQGMVVHPARGSLNGTLVNALLHSFNSLSDVSGDSVRPGIVHRLDKDTSGLLAVAKNNAAHLSLSRQIADKTAKRYYIALVDGYVKEETGIIDTFIGRNQKDRTKMAVQQDGRKAVTLYKVLKRYKNFSLVEFELKTGRTHQIRVHSKHIGHPVTGDKVYGGSLRFETEGQLLHAYRLIVAHPSTGIVAAFEAPLPDYFKKIIDKLDKNENL
ncbi:MAG: RluA family pseudouridine synthase [Clostridiales bacterium]|jgi:23S rRNA pseudouridine1911/1915/1917 synthase|nr:RluA family pseudouridine synthase [Clostridiales bacterium]